MDLLKKIALSALLVTALSACGGGGSNSTGNPVQGGVAQKGPLINGSALTVKELDTDLSPTGKQFSYQTTSDYGEFEANDEFSSRYISLSATGYYYDEVLGQLSSGPLTITAYSDLSTDSVLNINIFTTLVYQRINALVNLGSLSFGEARNQAKKELLAAFGIRETFIPENFTSLSLSGTSDGDYALAAISSLFVFGNTAGELSSLIANFQSDLADNGMIDDLNIVSNLSDSAMTLNSLTVANNLSDLYQSIGVIFSNENITNWIDQDGDGVIGKLTFVVSDAEPSTTYISEPYITGIEDEGVMYAVTNGTLLVNGISTPSTGALVSAGDSLTVSLISGDVAGSIVSSFLTRDSIEVAKFIIKTKPLPISLNTTINSLGLVNDVELSGDGNDLFISTADTCSGTSSCASPTGDGGLYIYSVSNPSIPQYISNVGYPTSGYSWTSYTSVILSGDQNTAFISSSQQQFQLLDVSDTTTPSLISSFPTSCQAMGFVQSSDDSAVFVANSCKSLLRINISGTPDGWINTTAAINAQHHVLSISPDDSQIAMASQGRFEVIPILSNEFGDSIVIGSLTGLSPVGVAYIANKIVIVVSYEISTIPDAPADTPKQIHFSVLDLTDPSLPELISEVVAEQTVQENQSYAAIKYSSSTEHAYVAIADKFSIIDLRDFRQPVISGEIVLPPTSKSNLYRGITASPDGSNIYVTQANEVIVLNN